VCVTVTMEPVNNTHSILKEIKIDKKFIVLFMRHHYTCTQYFTLEYLSFSQEQDGGKSYTKVSTCSIICGCGFIISIVSYQQQ